jgi:hypothetical protein
LSFGFRRWGTNLRGSITRRWWTNLRGSITTNPVHYGGGLLDVLKGNIVEVLMLENLFCSEN